METALYEQRQARGDATALGPDHVSVSFPSLEDEDEAAIDELAWAEAAGRRSIREEPW